MRIFISYSTRDRMLADKLYDLLRDRMHLVWIDRVQMRPGDSLMAKIKGAIESSDILLALITRSSIRSQWVRKEIRIAMDLEGRSGGPRVIPLVIKPCRVPGNLKRRLYLDVTKKDLKLYKLLGALHRDSFILQINLSDSDFSVDLESIRMGLLEYYRNSCPQIHIYIENHDFNSKLLSLMDYSLTDDEMPPMAIEQIRDARQSLPVTLPFFWRSLEIILEQLIMDLYVKENGSLGTLEGLNVTFESIFEYALSALVDELKYGIFTFYAKDAGRQDIAAFVKKYKKEDWLDFVAWRLGGASRQDLYPIDLIGKDGITTTRIWTHSISGANINNLQGRGMSVAASPAGTRWYSEYLPQIIGREIRLIALRKAKLMQQKGYAIGLHMDDYVKAGLG